MKKWIPAKFGAEPRKVVFLGALLVLAGYIYLSNRPSDSGAVARPTGGSSPVAASPRTLPRNAARARANQRSVSSTTREFRPSFKTKDIDPSGVDPTLNLAKLAQLQDVKQEGGARSLFEISAAPPADAKIKEPDKIPIQRAMVGPMPPPPPPPPPPDPKAPPIPLKFYGFVNPTKAADKRAFFLHGEDIIIASEGELIEKRYKIIRIGINSAVVEDTQFKSDNQQTLPLEAEMAG